MDFMPCRCGERTSFTIRELGAPDGPRVGIIDCDNCWQRVPFVFFYHDQMNEAAMEAWNQDITKLAQPQKEDVNR